MPPYQIQRTHGRYDIRNDQPSLSGISENKQKVTITKTVEKFNTSNKRGNLEETKDSPELEINQDESLIPPWFR